MSTLRSKNAVAIDVRDDQGRTPFLLATQYGHMDIIITLLDNGADLHAQGGCYGDAIQAASYGGHLAAVQLLLENGAIVDKRGGTYGSALMAASSQGHVQVVRTLAEAGADVNVRVKDFRHPLHTASAGGHEVVVRLLISKGSKTDTFGGIHGSALQAAAYGGNASIVKLLLDGGIDVNIGCHVHLASGYYDSALQAAAFRGHSAVVDLLLESGADNNARGQYYGGASWAALQGGHKRLAEMLKKSEVANSCAGPYHPRHLNFSGVEQYRKSLFDHNTALLLTTTHENDGKVKLLLENGADVNAQGERYGNFVNFLACKGYTSLLHLSYDYYEADLCLTDKHGRTPLHIAARYGHVETFDYLLQLGFHPKTKDFGGSDALDYACSAGSVSSVDNVLKHLPFEEKKVENWSPLHWACRRGDSEVVNRLIQLGFRGSCIATPQPQGLWSPAAIAIYHGQKDMLAKLSPSYRMILGGDHGDVTGAQPSEHHTYIWCEVCHFVSAQFACPMGYGSPNR